MSVESHIETISYKREQLKRRIAQEMNHPSPDFTLITKLKKQNLILKEETQRMLQRENLAAAS